MRKIGIINNSFIIYIISTFCYIFNEGCKPSSDRLILASLNKTIEYYNSYRNGVTYNTSDSHVKVTMTKK